MRRSDGYGYEWDALLLGGPADGCVDITIVVNGETPPKFIKRVVDGKEMSRETLGQKLIEYLTSRSMDEKQRVAAYGLKEITQDQMCLYEYLETVTMKEFRSKYEASPKASQ
jgi:hypothetical protein